MTRRRWIADELPDPNHAALTGEHADHLIRVLRAQVGQEFDIATGSTVRRGRISKIHEHRVEFDLGEELPQISAVKVTLLLSVFKFDRMEWAIEKCTELGIVKIIPLLARRTDAHLTSSAAKRLERWRKIALQAAEQSRRTAPPEIAVPVKVQEAVKMPGSLKILLNESEEQETLRETVSAHKSDTHVLLAIGPEGGWTHDELQMFQEQGWISASLGNTILRAETAAIAATAITIAE
jgi:16S rRNA (uracil1498-N3)-methyltransferase